MRECLQCGATWNVAYEQCPHCHAPVEPLAVVIAPRGYIYAYSRDELDVHQTFHEQNGWPYRVFYAPTVLGGAA